MNLRILKILIVLIGLAFIGLIVIQIYWINNSIVLREQEFDVKLNGALDNVVKNLEINERARNQESIHELSDFLSESEHSELTLDTRTENTEIAVEENLDFEESESQYDFENMEKSQNEIMEQSGILSDIIDGLYTLDVYQNITDKTNYDEIDSMLQSELNKVDIKAKFRFGVFNKNQEPEILSDSDQENMPVFIESTYFRQLYPNELVHDPYYLRVIFPKIKRYIVKKMWVMLTISGFLILLMISAFMYTIKTIIRQKQLSAVKNDFINNMTHELKTPISTISLACEALSDRDMLKTEGQYKSYVSMIREENKRLGQLVEKVLRTSVLDQGEMDLKLVQVNVHDLIKKVVNSIAIQVRNRGGTIKLKLNAVNPVISGDRVHLTNVIYNLIDNAVKYSLSNPVVEISSEDDPQKLTLKFRDNGIGIVKENQGKIFDRLYRIPTGNVHNVKGFGLGLSYVKAIVQRHGGSIDVESELNKGSEFKVVLPRESFTD